MKLIFRSTVTRGASVPVGRTHIPMHSCRPLPPGPCLSRSQSKVFLYHSGFIPTRSISVETNKGSITIDPNGPLPLPPIAEISKESDPYAWLQRLGDGSKLGESVQKYIDLENDYMVDVMTLTGARFREKYWRKEISKFDCKDDETGEGVAEILDGFSYYTRWQNNYPIYCRKLLSGGQEEILLNQEDLANIHERVSVGIMKVSPCNRFVAYTIDTTGDEKYELVIKSIESRTVAQFKQRISLAVNFEWTLANVGENPVLLYTVPDSLLRPYQVFAYTLRDDPESTCKIFEETNPRFFVDIVRTKDNRFIVIACNSKTTSEIRVIDSKLPYGEMKTLKTRREGVEYYVDRWRKHWFLISNADPAAGPDNKIAANGTNYGVWAFNDTGDVTLIVPQDSYVQINDVDVFDDFLVLYERADSLPRIRVFDIKESESGGVEVVKESIVPLPSVGAIEAGINLDYHGHQLRFTFSSPLIPPVVYDYDMKGHKLVEVHSRRTQEVLQVNDFECKRLFISKSNMEGIPITIVHRKNMEFNWQNDVVVHVYGAYGHNVEAEWKAENAALLNQGYVIVFAHVRGGGEKGRAWYDSGRLLSKYQGVLDLRDCLNHLIESRISHPRLISVITSSAGGVLVASLANETGRSFFSSAVLRVPFVDVLTAMEDPALPLTQHEYDEFGNPENSEIRKAILKYDPYRNVEKGQSYPHMLLTASTMDIRVPYWGPLKWVAKVRALKRKDNSLLLLRIDDDRGHFGEGGRNGAIRERAFDLAFLEAASIRDFE